MRLFENETVSVTRLRTVNIFESFAGVRKSFDVSLPSYELIFILSGETKVHFGGKEMLDVTDSVRYLPKGKISGEYSIDVVSDVLCIDIYFDSDDKLPDTALVFKGMTDLRPLFTKAYNVWTSKRCGYYAECMSIMYDIVRRMKIHGEKYSTSEKSKKLMPSVEYMHEHYTDKDFDYGEMCKKSGLSYSYFKELFVKRYGIPPVKYITNLRIERAKELLLTGLFTVAETAQECGFESVYYFSKVFKNHTGVTPKNYKYSDRV